MVQSPQEPAARHFVLDVVHALPRRIGAGTIGHPQHHTGQDLDEETKTQGAAPHIAPPGSSGNTLEEHFMQQPGHPGALIDPLDEFLHVRATFAGIPERKFWKRNQTDSPRTSTAKVSMERGLGERGSLIEPSTANVLSWQGQKKAFRSVW